MMGQTHKKVGALMGIALSGVLPGMFNYPLSIAAIGTAMFSAMLADADAGKSAINQQLVHKNPVVGAMEGVVHRFEEIISFIVKLIISIVAGTVLFVNAEKIAKAVVALVNQHMYYLSINTALKILGILLILAGLIPTRQFKNIPLIGDLYSAVAGVLHKATLAFNRCMVVVVYGGIGAILMVYNYKHNGDALMYLCGVLLIITGLLPHRGFLHTPFAAALYTLCAWYIGNKVGVHYLFAPFAVGYVSHLISDMLTNEGIPIWYSVSKNRWIRFSLHLMSTGSELGSKMELVYVILNIVLVFVIHNVNYILKGLTRLI